MSGCLGQGFRFALLVVLPHDIFQQLFCFLLTLYSPPSLTCFLVFLPHFLCVSLPEPQYPFGDNILFSPAFPMFLCFTLKLPKLSLQSSHQLSLQSYSSADHPRVLSANRYPFLEQEMQG